MSAHLQHDYSIKYDKNRDLIQLITRQISCQGVPAYRIDCSMALRRLACPRGRCATGVGQLLKPARAAAQRGRHRMRTERAKRAEGIRVRRHNRAVCENVQGPAGSAPERDERPGRTLDGYRVRRGRRLRRELLPLRPVGPPVRVVRASSSVITRTATPRRTPAARACPQLGDSQALD